MAEKCDVLIGELLDSAILYLRGSGYAEGTIEHHRARWRKFADYARRRKEQRFSRALAEQFLRSLPSARGRPYWHRSRTIPHSMRILLEFSATGRHRPRNKPPDQPLPTTFDGTIRNALAFAERELGWSKGTLINRNGWIRRFIRHAIAQRGIRTWGDVDAADLPAYLSSVRIGRGSRATACSSIKAMFRVLFIQGVLPTPLHEKTPPFARAGDAELSAVWLPSEIEAILAAVDRSTAIGKRNYAILLLATKLGLRACDIRNLRMDNLRWERSCIQIVQQKTGVPLALPLLPEVGDALIDYLRHGRPPRQFREVFLRHIAPCGPLGKYCFGNILEAHRKKASLPKRARAGLSSLRHTLATRMLERGTGVETIAGVLGHTCVETTRRYIRIDLPLLRQAGLDPDKEVAHV